MNRIRGCLLLLCLLAALATPVQSAPGDPTAIADNGAVIFPALLSTNNTVLMTNAEFRSTMGSVLLFKNDDGYRKFSFEQLSPDVLHRLGMDPEKMAAEKKAKEERDKSNSLQNAFRQQRAADDRNHTSGTRMPKPQFPAWTTVQPKRAERPAVALSDSQACLYELADVASLPYEFSPLARLLAPRRPTRFDADPHEDVFQEGGFYFTRPGEAMDDDATVKMLDATVRLDRLEQAQDPEIRRAAHNVHDAVIDIWRVYRAAQDFQIVNQSKEAGRNVQGSLITHLVMWELQEVTDPREVTVQDSPRMSHQETVRTGPNEAQQSYVEEYEEDVKQAQADVQSIQKYANRLSAVMDADLDRLEAVWESDILPLAKSRFKEVPATNLLSHPDKAIPRAARLGFSSFPFRNETGRTLSNLFVQVNYQGESGDSTHWCGFVPAFPSEDVVITRGVGSAATTLNALGGPIHGTASVWSPDGVQTGLQADRAARAEPGGGNPSPSEDPIQAAREKLLAGLDEARADVEKKSAELRAVYAAPMDPALLRKQLIAAIKPGREYHVVSTKHTGVIPDTITVGPLDDASGVVTARLTFNDPATRVKSGELIGRFREECERGCAIGFVAKGSVPDEAWQSGLVWLYTSPSEVANIKQDRTFSHHGGLFGIVKQPGDDFWMRRDAITRLANYGLYLAPKGELCLQVMVNDYDDIQYFKLE
jgi:hypothetical protein